MILYILVLNTAHTGYFNINNIIMIWNNSFTYIHMNVKNWLKLYCLQVHYNY